MKLIHCEKNRSFFSGYTITHEHDFIKIAPKYMVKTKNSAVKCLTCGVVYCTACGRPLKSENYCPSVFLNKVERIFIN